MTKRLGLSMRIAEEKNYTERRDAIAHDWWPFLAHIDSFQAVPVPNIGARNAVQYYNLWKLDGLILSGGNDLGQYIERDSSEKALLKFCIDNKHPVFGVCRGLQLINKFLGGSLTPIANKSHSGNRHEIELSPSPMMALGVSGGRYEVNSYHNYVVKKPDLAPGLVPLATAQDGTIEAFYHPEVALTAVMWHPEREPQAQRHDLEILNWALTRRTE